MANEVPEAIISGINRLLEPYGTSYEPGTRAPGKGYMTPAKAMRYLGVGRTTFYRLVHRGAIRVKKVNDGAKNGLALVAIEDLDRLAR